LPLWRLRATGAGGRLGSQAASFGMMILVSATIREAIMELGRYGVFGHSTALTTERARVLESLGYGTVWEGGSPPADLSHVTELLDATSTIKVATGIVNVWTADAADVARSYHRIEAAHPGRFLLGVGVGHPEAIDRYHSPYQALVDYLDVLDAEGVPAERRVLAALGPRVLRLAAARTAGAHPYLVTPEHTRLAREILGPGKILAPEQRVVLEADPARARAVGRPSVVKPYLGLTNYTSNLRRLGFTEQDVAGEGSDRLIDALVVSGDDAEIRRRFEEHFQAGADHVAIQLIAGAGDDPEAGFRRLAGALQLS
jgi:probable F420-dependent oxidoreductase